MKNHLFKTCILTGIMLCSLPNYAGTAHSTETGGKWNDQTTWVEGFVPGENDTAVINGPVIVGHVDGYDIYHTYAGWVIVEPGGLLQPHEYGAGLGTFILHVDHDVINRGTLNNYAAPDIYEHLQLNIQGDIYNEGAWHPYKTILTGTEQHISQSEESSFGGYWECASQQNIYAQSNFSFDGLYFVDTWNRGDFNLNKAVLHLDDHAIDATGTLVFNGTLEGDFEIIGRFSVNKSPADTLHFIGNVTVTDTLESNVYGGGLGIQNLWIEGNLTNNGVVRDDQDTRNDDRLRILITGDIVNNGKWTCYYVHLIGDQEQSITQAPGKEFDSYFIDLNPASSIIAGSDITILHDFDLGNASINMKGQALSIGGWLHKGMLDNANLHGGYLQYLDCINVLDMHGLVIIDDSVSFEGPVTVHDTLMPNAYGGGAKHYHLPITSGVTNHGVIMDNSGGESLFLYISGNITNNGEWVNYLTHVYVSDEQYIELLDDKPIEGAVEFDAVVQAETYQWYFEGNILDSPDFSGETSQVLSWQVPVSADWYGSFTCETGTRETVGIMVKKGFLGVEDIAQEIGFTVYPNPTRGKFQITYPSTQINSRKQTSIDKLEVVDIYGKVAECFNPYPVTRNTKLDISHLPAGVYFVRILIEDQMIVKKIIKM